MSGIQLSNLVVTIVFVFILSSVTSPVICQRTVVGFGNNNQNFQQQEFVLSNGAQVTIQRSLQNPIETFHQFQVVSVPSSSEERQPFHPEQPPPPPVQQNFARPTNEIGPPQPRPQQREREREGRTQQDGQQQPRIMSDTCLACLCQASTECNMTTRCISGDQYCGAFLISKPYWDDGRKPTLVGDNPERPEAFIDCAVDPVCSAQTVRNYMQRFEKDCNGDGAIDCDDLARIHLMSAFDCSNPKVPTTRFYQKFRTCWDRVLQLSQK